MGRSHVQCAGDFAAIHPTGEQKDDVTTLMKNLLARFVKDESGATAIEYGLIAAGIALAIITVVNNLGTTISGKFGSISSSLK